MVDEKGCLLFSFVGGLPITTDGFHVWERESPVPSPSSMKEPDLEFFLQLLFPPFGIFKQGLLSSRHGLCSFHRFRGDCCFPNLSLEELFQGSFHLLDVLVCKDHLLLRGKQ
ncbi:hypothetical protein PIB30_092652, partial [Stylosanthes scabra]|nr:hypothetical protein [Stylosanthes scabra]